MIVGLLYEGLRSEKQLGADGDGQSLE